MRQRPAFFSRYRIARREGRHVSTTTAILMEGYVQNFWERHGYGPNIDDFIREAMPEGSRYHHLLPWDAKKALRAQQEAQARFLLNCYEYIEIDAESGEDGRRLRGTISLKEEIILQDDPGLVEMGRLGGESDGGEDEPEEVRWERYQPSFVVVEACHQSDYFVAELKRKLASMGRELRDFEDVLKERLPGYQLILEGIEQATQEEQKVAEPMPVLSR